MAIGKTNISIDLVRRTIGSSKTDVGGLCTDDKVNMFSYYKPVDSDKITTDPNSEWPALVKGSFGINIPDLTLPVDTSQNWSWDKPKGGALSPYRLSDFGGYDHAAKPCISSGCTGKVSVNMADSGYTRRTFSFEQIPADSRTNVSAMNIGDIQDYYWGFALLESLSSTSGTIRTCDKTIKEGGHSLTVDFADIGILATHKYLLFFLSKQKSTGVAPDIWDLNDLFALEAKAIYHDEVYINPVPLNIFWSLLYSLSLVGMGYNGAIYDFYPVANFVSSPMPINGTIWLKVRVTNNAEHSISFVPAMCDVEVVSLFGTVEKGSPLAVLDLNGKQVNQIVMAAAEVRELVYEINLFSYYNGEQQFELPGNTVTTHVNISTGSEMQIQTGNFKIRGM